MQIKDYIGDGVYAAFDGFNIILTTENGVETRDTIYIEPEVLAALNRFNERARAKAKEMMAQTAIGGQMKGEQIETTATEGGANNRKRL